MGRRCVRSPVPSRSDSRPRQRRGDRLDDGDARGGGRVGHHVRGNVPLPSGSRGGRVTDFRWNPGRRGKASDSGGFAHGPGNLVAPRARGCSRDPRGLLRSASIVGVGGGCGRTERREAVRRLVPPRCRAMARKCAEAPRRLVAGTRSHVISSATRHRAPAHPTRRSAAILQYNHERPREALDDATRVDHRVRSKRSPRVWPTPSRKPVTRPRLSRVNWNVAPAAMIDLAVAPEGSEAGRYT